MFDLKTITRKNVREMKPYSSARNEFNGIGNIFLDANENPFGDYNRYPDPFQNELKNEISALREIPVENIFIGNGSDETIDLLFRIFCQPKEDRVLAFNPTYGMYEVSAALNEVEISYQSLGADFEIEVPEEVSLANDPTLKIIFICSPNNPTGNSMDRNKVLKILERFPGIVVVDEAYIDFSREKSFAQLIPKFPNLIVTQTMSKAWGLASARIGWCFAQKEIVSLLNKVKPPYNVSGPNQEVALKTLKSREAFEQNLREIIQQRDWLTEKLEQLQFVQRVFPSDANFLLVEVENALEIYEQLVQAGIIVRNRQSVVRNCLRITVGSKAENETLINTLKTF